MQISSNYSMNGVPYENRRRQKDIPQFSTERAKQENKSINPYMEAAKEVNANGMGIKKNGTRSCFTRALRLYLTAPVAVPRFLPRK